MKIIDIKWYDGHNQWKSAFIDMNLQSHLKIKQANIYATLNRRILRKVK